MSTQRERAIRFLELHQGPEPLVMANAWDIGSARLFASLGFQALATTSSGFAATLGRVDGAVTRDEAISHGAALCAAVDIPVSADLENCFAHSPVGVAATIELAIDAGLAGGSVEDFSGRGGDPQYDDIIYDIGLATERVAAAAEAAHAGDRRFVLTARAEGFLHGRPDLAEVIERLQAFERAGADVLFAPGVVQRDAIEAVVKSIGLPLNVLPNAVSPNIGELGVLGVRRTSVGGGFAWVAYGAAADAARDLLTNGTYGYQEHIASGRQAARDAFNG
jgi:2-methylisocitrate lyase-like PEP mutase family enzyme